MKNLFTLSPYLKHNAYWFTLLFTLNFTYSIPLPPGDDEDDLYVPLVKDIEWSCSNPGFDNIDYEGVSSLLYLESGKNITVIDQLVINFTSEFVTQVYLDPNTNSFNLPALDVFFARFRLRSIETIIDSDITGSTYLIKFFDIKDFDCLLSEFNDFKINNQKVFSIVQPSTILNYRNPDIYRTFLESNVYQEAVIEINNERPDLLSTYNQLDIQELVAIRMYTAEFQTPTLYSILLTEMAANSMSFFNLGFAQAITNGISKMPNFIFSDRFNRVTYRGMEIGTEPDDMSTLEVGQVLEYKPFVATSKNIETAVNFAEDSRVIIKFVGGVGADIGQISTVLGEDEVLLLPDLFEIIEKQESVTFEGADGVFTLFTLDLFDENAMEE